MRKIFGARVTARSVTDRRANSLDLLAQAREGLARISELNAIVELAPRAEAEARAAAAGPLAGVPVVVKDLFYDSGRCPTMGSAVQAPARDGTAEILQRLRRAGAVVSAYANLHEWAIGVTSAYTAGGPIRNPADAQLMAGGSSGGSAVAVAAGAVSVSVGTDSGGSIRIPAACCGIVGVKPTRGLVPDAGAVGAGSVLFHAGPLARTVDDARLLLEVLAGRRFDPVRLDGLRAGIARTFFCDDLHPEVETGVEVAAAALGALLPVTEVVVDGAEQAGGAVSTLHLAHTAGVIGDDIEKRSEDFHPKTLALLERGIAAGQNELATAEEIRRRVTRGWQVALEEVDVVLTPTLPAPPGTIERRTIERPSGLASAEVDYLAHNAPMNLAGVPAVTLPFGDGSGRSVGITISAAPGRDDVALAVAEALESELN